MAFESRIQHGPCKGMTLDEIDDELCNTAMFRIPGGAFGATGKRTDREAHDAFVDRLETHTTFSHDKIRSIAGDTATRYDRRN